MEIIVHRGTHQIGGRATESRTGTTRVLIDFGAELPDENGFQLYRDNNLSRSNLNDLRGGYE